MFSFLRLILAFSVGLTVLQIPVVAEDFTIGWSRVSGSLRAEALSVRGVAYPVKQTENAAKKNFSKSAPRVQLSKPQPAFLWYELAFASLPTVWLWASGQFISAAGVVLVTALLHLLGHQVVGLIITRRWSRYDFKQIGYGLLEIRPQGLEDDTEQLYDMSGSLFNLIPAFACIALPGMVALMNLTLLTFAATSFLLALLTFRREGLPSILSALDKDFWPDLVDIVSDSLTRDSAFPDWHQHVLANLTDRFAVRIVPLRGTSQVLAIGPRDENGEWPMRFGGALYCYNDMRGLRLIVRSDVADENRLWSVGRIHRGRALFILNGQEVASFDNEDFFEDVPPDQAVYFQTFTQRVSAYQFAFQVRLKYRGKILQRPAKLAGVNGIEGHWLIGEARPILAIEPSMFDSVLMPKFGVVNFSRLGLMGTFFEEVRALAPLNLIVRRNNIVSRKIVEPIFNALVQLVADYDLKVVVPTMEVLNSAIVGDFLFAVSQESRMTGRWLDFESRINEVLQKVSYPAERMGIRDWRLVWHRLSDEENRQIALEAMRPQFFLSNATEAIETVSLKFFDKVDLRRTAHFIRKVISKRFVQDVRGTLWSIDGQSGGYKSSLADEIQKRYEQDAIHVVRVGGDEMMQPRVARTAVKKRLAGLPLEEWEFRELHKFGWSDVHPKIPWFHEDTFWDNDEIARLLTEIRAFLKAPKHDVTRDDEEREFVYHVYSKDRFYRREERTITVRRDSVVLVEFKYANSKRFQGFFDVPIRLEDAAGKDRESPDRARARFLAREAARDLRDGRDPAEAALREPFYDLALKPTWDRHVLASKESVRLDINETVLNRSDPFRLIVFVRNLLYWIHRPQLRLWLKRVLLTHA